MFKEYLPTLCACYLSNKEKCLPSFETSSNLLNEYEKMLSAHKEIKANEALKMQQLQEDMEKASESFRLGSQSMNNMNKI